MAADGEGKSGRKEITCGVARKGWKEKIMEKAGGLEVDGASKTWI